MLALITYCTVIHFRQYLSLTMQHMIINEDFSSLLVFCVCARAFSALIPLAPHCPVASRSYPVCLHVTSDLPDRCVTVRCSAVPLAGCLTSSH